MSHPENDALLSSLLKLLNGDRQRAYQLIATVKQKYPDKGLKWCIDKVVYDLRWGQKQVQPNPTLSRWSGSDAQPTPQKPPKPPAPPPNPKLVDVMSASTAELAALLRKKQQPPKPIPTPKTLDIHTAKGATKYELYRLAGNQDVAHRLVEANCYRYADRSVQWCWEKAIADLERDRL